MDIRERLTEEMKTLRTLRDELRVRVHLGRLEAREQWERLEKDWDKLEGRMKLVAEASRESADAVGEAARELAGEIREGYERVRDSL